MFLISPWTNGIDLSEPSQIAHPKRERAKAFSWARKLKRVQDLPGCKASAKKREENNGPGTSTCPDIS